jgi:hypothetical protein
MCEGRNSANYYQRRYLALRQLRGNVKVRDKKVQLLCLATLVRAFVFGPSLAKARRTAKEHAALTRSWRNGREKNRARKHGGEHRMHHTPHFFHGPAAAHTQYRCHGTASAMWGSDVLYCSRENNAMMHYSLSTEQRHDASPRTKMFWVIPDDPRACACALVAPAVAGRVAVPCPPCLKRSLVRAREQLHRSIGYVV